LAATITRIDPARNVAVATVTTGDRPEGIVGDAGGLFVPVRASGATHRGGTLTALDSSDDLQHLDPADAYSYTEWEVVTLTNDGLVGFRRVGGSAGTQLVPDLAVSLPVPTDGGRTYAFRLRPGIRYSTGELVRPADFRRAIERAVLHPLGSGSYFAEIVGAHRCMTTPGKPCDLIRGIAVDRAADTVTFHLTAPDPDFLYKPDLPAAFAVPARTPLFVRGFVPATGRYEIASFNPRRGVRLARNPRFREWSPAAQPAGFPDEIVVRVTGTPDAHIAAILHGSADITQIGLNAGTPSPRVLDAVRTQHASQLEVNPWQITWYLALNTRARPFNEVAARRAVNFAIDRRRLGNLTLGHGFGQVTCQILPPDFTSYRRYCPYTAAAAEPGEAGAWTAPDLKRARRLVRSSGTAGETVTVWLPSWTRFPAAAGKYVVAVLDSIGYRAHARLSKGSDAQDHEDKLHVQALFSGWYADFASPGGFINPVLTCGSYNPDNSENSNYSEFCDPAIDREIARARSLQTTDPAAVSPLWARIDHDLTNQAPWVPFANGVIVDVVSTRVGNYQNNPQWGTLLDQLWVR
jgi:ABC-type transport system substrate-binding protein